MSFNFASRLNPELVRGARVTLPRRRALFIAGLTLAILAAGGWILWNNSYVRPSYVAGKEVYGAAQRLAMQEQRFGREAFGALTVVLFGLLFILGPATAGLSFIQERLRGTAIFQQMSLLSPARLAAGKFAASGLLAYYVAALVLPFALVAALLGGVDPGKVARLYLFLFAGGLCWQAVGLFVSSALSGPAEKALRGGLLVGPAVAVGGAITALALNQFFTTDLGHIERMIASGNEYYRSELDWYWWHFFGASVPAYVLILGLLAFAGAGAFAGAVQRIKVWQLIPVRPHAVRLFFAAAEALLVGLFWGRHENDTEPIGRLVIFMLFNWAALALLAATSALTRGRLREWWSAERDPVAVFGRGEIRDDVKTFLLVLGLAEAGLLALWVSYHLMPGGGLQGLALFSQFLPVALCFALTVVAVAAFVQFCAMYRFRIGGWAGLCLTVVFYAFVTLAGVMFERRSDTPALLNPLYYADVVTQGDLYMDSQLIEAPPRGAYVPKGYRTVYFPGGATEPAAPEDFSPGVRLSAYREPDTHAAEARVQGVVLEGVLAFLCAGLAFVKWNRTREEMLQGESRAQ